MGLLVVSLSGYRLFEDGISYLWLILASLAVVTGSFTVKIPGVNSKISVADTFVFMNLILFGPEAGAITAALDGFAGSIRARTVSRRLHYTLFNMGAMALSGYAAGKIFLWLLGQSPLYGSQLPALGAAFLPAGLLALAYHFFNSGSVALIIALDARKNIYRIWRESFLWTSATYLTCGLGSVLLAGSVSSVNPMVLSAALPLLLIVHFTYKSYVAKIEQNLEGHKLNKLYLGTLETLVKAVDARDQTGQRQTTRVQVYARGLARAVGMTDESALRGIEVAALLHDIGKLAVPEHILNKPGKLTRGIPEGDAPSGRRSGNRWFDQFLRYSGRLHSLPARALGWLRISVPAQRNGDSFGCQNLGYSRFL